MDENGVQAMATYKGLSSNLTNDIYIGAIYTLMYDLQSSPVNGLYVDIYDDNGNCGLS